MTTPTPLLVVDIDGTVREGKAEMGKWCNTPDDVKVMPAVDFVLTCDPCLRGILRGDNPLRCSWDGMTSGCLLHVYIDRVEQL